MPATPVYAVVGQPIAHSVSPAMHNAAFGRSDAAGVYVPCEAESFDDFLGLAEALPIVGRERDGAVQGRRGGRRGRRRR